MVNIISTGGLGRVEKSYEIRRRLGPFGLDGCDLGNLLHRGVPLKDVG
jgi:hypothetical protein